LSAFFCFLLFCFALLCVAFGGGRLRQASIDSRVFEGELELLACEGDDRNGVDDDGEEEEEEEMKYEKRICSINLCCFASGSRQTERAIIILRYNTTTYA
jgi:hypothetical protein